MEDNIVKLIIAIIGLIGTIFGGFSSYLISSKKQAVKEAKREQNQSDLFNNIFNELNAIKKRLDEHNSYGEKFAENSKNLAVFNERQTTIIKTVETMQKDIDYLKSTKCKLK